MEKTIDRHWEQKMAKHKETLDYVKALIEGGNEAWKRFYSINKKNIESYLTYKYPALGSLDIEEICDNVQNRLINNDYKALREYRGECSFESFIITATNWAVKDWFRINSSKLLKIPFDEKIDLEKQSPDFSDTFIRKQNLPEQIRALPDNLRQAFLLRYYDDFGFPPKEISLLARKTEKQIREITEVLIKCFSPKGENLLTRRRGQKNSLEVSLQRYSSSIVTQKRTEEKLSKKMAICSDKKKHKEIENELKKTRVKIRSLERRRDVIAKKVHAPTQTPYEIIAKIMGINSVSTIRSWVKKAKEFLREAERQK